MFNIPSYLLGAISTTIGVLFFQHKSLQFPESVLSKFPPIYTISPPDFYSYSYPYFNTLSTLDSPVVVPITKRNESTALVFVPPRPPPNRASFISMVRLLFTMAWEARATALGCVATSIWAWIQLVGFVGFVVLCSAGVFASLFLKQYSISVSHIPSCPHLSPSSCTAPFFSRLLGRNVDIQRSSLEC